MRYRGNDYSVPTSHGFQEVLVKGFVDHVVIACAGQQIARHQRAYGTGTFVFDSRQGGMTSEARRDPMPMDTTSGTPQVLLGHHLKQLKLPTILREYDTYHVHILTMNGDSYRLKQSAARQHRTDAETAATQNQATAEIIDPGTGEIRV